MRRSESKVSLPRASSEEVQRLQYDRGRYDGLAGFSPTDTAESYVQGYHDGRASALSSYLNF